jgi:predicted GNAT family acetyltransferase
LVAQISDIIKDENLTPMLYTDLSNPASNKAYKNVGFIECGKVNEVKFLFE